MKRRPGSVSCRGAKPAGRRALREGLQIQQDRERENGEGDKGCNDHRPRRLSH